MAAYLLALFYKKGKAVKKTKQCLIQGYQKKNTMTKMKKKVCVDMELSKRLQTVADFVTQKTVADIGTDHGYVPIYLHKKGVAEKIIACDINKKPLEKARENIQRANAQNVILTRLGNGLEPIRPQEVQSIVIAGMGGMLMISLLENAPHVVQTVNELVLCPHLDVAKVRKYVQKIGFYIAEEKMILEEGKYYTILHMLRGKEAYEKEIEYIFGKILLQRRDTVLKQYLKKEKIRLEKIERALYETQTEQSKLRLQQIQKQKRNIKEAEKWLYCAEKL